jgi:hypothetical protein
MMVASASPSQGVRTDAEDAVLRVQHDRDVVGQEVGDERRQPDPEVHVGAVDEFPGGAGGAMQPLR